MKTAGVFRLVAGISIVNLFLSVAMSPLSVASDVGAQRSVTSVSGTVSCKGSKKLPSMSTVHIELFDLSTKDSRLTALGDQKIWIAAGKLPVSFRIDYDPSQIDPQHIYAIRVRIMDGEKVLFVNSAPNRVITLGAPDKIDIEVIPVRARTH